MSEISTLNLPESQPVKLETSCFYTTTCTFRVGHFDISKIIFGSIRLTKEVFVGSAIKELHGSTLL